MTHPADYDAPPAARCWHECECEDACWHVSECAVPEHQPRVTPPASTGGGS